MCCWFNKKMFVRQFIFFWNILKKVLKKQTDILQFRVIELTSYAIIGHTWLHSIYQLFYFGIRLWPVGVKKNNLHKLRPPISFWPNGSLFGGPSGHHWLLEIFLRNNLSGCRKMASCWGLLLCTFGFGKR